MRRKLISLALTLILLLALCPIAQAEGGYIMDQAGLLDQDQIHELEALAASAGERYGLGVYVIALEDYRDYGRGDVFNVAMDLYEALDLGLGEYRDGILLLLSMAERDYALAGYGQGSHRAVTDLGLSYLEDSFLPFFREDDWAGGINAYVEGCLWLLEQDSLRESYGAAPERGGGMSPLGRLGICLGISALVSGSVCAAMAWSMKKARAQTRARGYIPQGGVDLRISRDMFIQRSVKRTPIPKNDGPKGGGTTINSRGFSGRSGKF